MTPLVDSKDINNSVGQGGGRRERLSRAERQNNGPHRNLDRRVDGRRHRAGLTRRRGTARLSNGFGQQRSPRSLTWGFAEERMRESNPRYKLGNHPVLEVHVGSDLRRCTSRSRFRGVRVSSADRCSPS
nr:DUF6243 family protein [Streptomyces sp. TLI_105]